MTSSRIYEDFMPVFMLSAAGLTARQCRHMQSVVLHSFMEKSHQPNVAREILEMLGLACHFMSDENDMPMASAPIEPL